MLISIFFIIATVVQSIQITSNDYMKLNSSQTSLIRFTTHNCSYCKEFDETIWSKLRNQYENKSNITFYEIQCRNHSDYLCNTHLYIYGFPSVYWGNRLDLATINLPDRIIIYRLLVKSLESNYCTLRNSKGCNKHAKKLMAYQLNQTREHIFNNTAFFEKTRNKILDENKQFESDMRKKISAADEHKNKSSLKSLIAESMNFEFKQYAKLIKVFTSNLYFTQLSVKNEKIFMFMEMLRTEKYQAKLKEREDKIMQMADQKKQRKEFIKIMNMDI